MSATITGVEGIADAARRLRQGELVAFPTETVYGLGANALDRQAVARIFSTKGRPSGNPLIVHVADADAARALAAPGAWSDAAQMLAERFWPGPLTLVVEKAAHVPGIVTAGGPTVGVRVPSHPVALELLRACGVPVAAPSANRSEEVSPTTARHVADSLGPFADDLLILDGGPCQVGIESTVLDVTGDVPRILRPGMITRKQLETVVGPMEEGQAAGVSRAPGQMPRHYAPQKPVILSRDLATDVRAGDGVWQFVRSTGAFGVAAMVCAAPPMPEKYAARLYSKLRAFDAASNIERIVIELPPDAPEWAAIHDRLRRAATPKGSDPVDITENLE